MRKKATAILETATIALAVILLCLSASVFSFVGGSATTPVVSASIIK